MHSRRSTVHSPQSTSGHGFTLIELLIVIGIVGFLAAAILVAVDPVKRIQDARDARRFAEVNAILNAILNKQVDDRALYNGETGALIDSSATSSQVIVSTTAGVNCQTAATAPTCPDDGTLSLDLAGTTTCVVDLDPGIVSTYIGELPVDPVGSGNDPTPGTTDLVLAGNNTGYYLNRLASNRITIGACHGEQNNDIKVQR